MKHDPISPGWLSRPPPKLDAVQKYWLSRPGPLTQGLRRQGQVRIQVVGEFAEVVSTDEALTIRKQANTVVWVREIFMSGFAPGRWQIFFITTRLLYDQCSSPA